MASITRYFNQATESPSDHYCLSNPNGPPANSVPSSAIAAGNREVRAMLADQTKTTRGRKYNKYSSEERAALGKFASENGTNKVCVRKYRKQFQCLNESTVHRFKNNDCEEMARRRMETGQDNVTVKKLVLKKQGRPVILGKLLDETIQKYISSIRDADGVVNTPIVIAGARGIIQNMDRTMLAEYGGPASPTRGWANSILKRMNLQEGNTG